MKFTKIVLLIVLVVIGSSCTFTENIYINEDGTGKFSLEMDGSSLMAMMPKDSLKMEKAVDSVISFKKVFEEKKDSIAKLPLEKQQRIKKLENFSMRIAMLPKEEKFLFSLLSDFKSVADLQDAMGTMKELQELKGKNNKPDDKNPMSAISAGSFGENNSSLSYTYDGKKFTRKATILKKEIDEKENDSTNQSLKMIFASSSYIVKYHFPKPVKKVSNPTAQYSEDRKTITIEYPFKEYLESPEKLNFDVDFE